MRMLWRVYITRMNYLELLSGEDGVDYIRSDKTINFCKVVVYDLEGNSKRYLKEISCLIRMY